MKGNFSLSLAVFAAAICSLNAAASAALSFPPQTEVLDSGSYEARFTGGYSKYGNGGVGDAIAGLRIGLEGPVDLALATPHRYDFKTEHSGMRSSLIGIATYQIFDNSELMGTLQAYNSIAPSGEDQGVGSGANNFGIRANVVSSTWWEGGKIHLRGAWAEVDQRRPDEPPGPGSYRSAGVLSLEAGAEFEVDNPNTKPYLGIKGTSGVEANPRSEQDSLSIRPGVSFNLGNNNHVHMIAQLDVMQNGAEPENAAFVTFTYGFKPPPNVDYENRLTSLEERVSNLARSVSNLEVRMLEEGERAPETAAVVILNQSGISELMPLVEDTVKAANLTVTGTRNDREAPTRDRTVIRYLDNHRDEAVGLARSLPGNQLVDERDELPDGAGITILMGFDLERMLDQ